MSELLLELFSEEIPSSMQARAGEDLARLVSKGLQDAGLSFEAVRSFAGPRRLSLVIDGLPKKSSDVREERRGPRVDAPEKALQGFLRSTGLTLEECEVQEDKKGAFYVAVIDQAGRPTSEIIAQVVGDVVRKFPWSKSMSWGASSLKWVRPLHHILCVFDGKPVKFLVEHIASGNETRGHRFMAPKPFKVKTFDEYQTGLAEQFVVLDGAEREKIILKQAKALARQSKLKLVEDQGLLREVAGLVEWPCCLMGRFDKAFLDVPGEVLIAAMKKHQKCFSLKKGNTLANHFILVANLAADDEGAKIVEGNERVIHARLSDATFFWENDLKKPLDALLPKLEDIVFHAKLGTVAERAQRLAALSRVIAPLVGADETEAEQAAKLAKADLVSETVYEAPDMQGIAGKYLALAQGQSEAVAAAIEDHYKPKGPSDQVPALPVSIAVALAEKIELLTSFWAIDEKPTGSSDPFALRRAALGVIRLVLENGLRLSLLDLFKAVRADFDAEDDLLSFFADRLKVYLRDQGARHDLIDAVFALGGQDDLLMIVKRVEALSDFLGSDDGEALLAGVKRAQNILRIEEKKDKTNFVGRVDEALLVAGPEKALYSAVQSRRKAVEGHLASEDFSGVMVEIAKLRKVVDDFFEQVIVNDPDKAVRANRLELLAAMRALSLEVADFRKIEG